MKWEIKGKRSRTIQEWVVRSFSGVLMLSLALTPVGAWADGEKDVVAKADSDVEKFKRDLRAKRGAVVNSGESLLDQKLAKVKEEPTVREVQEAALRNFQVNTDQVNSMRARASMKALAPVVEFSGGYAISDMSESTDHYEYNYFPWISRGADGTGYDVRAKLAWNFPQLIFNAEELDVASLAGLVEGLLKESTRLYFMRRRLQIEMILNPPTDRASVLTKELRLEELTGLIDAMTGGWFQQELDRRKTL